MAFNLFEDYSKSRYQYISVNNTISNAEKVKTGVPQGSTFGLLLYLLHMNDILDTTFKTTLFADDTVLLISLKNHEALQQQVTSNFQKILHGFTKIN